MWTVERHDEFSKRFKKLCKKHRREVLNALSNLDTFHKALNAGAIPQQIQKGFIHPEPKGVLAMDESGKGQHLMAIRLYVFPDTKSKTLHVITIGDKSTQDLDIRLSSAFVDGLRNS